MNILIHNDYSFQGIVKKYFQFLVDDFSYHLIEDPYYYNSRSVSGKYEFLRYESEKVFVKIGYSNYEYELNLLLGLIKENEKEEKSYTLEEVLSLAGEKDINLNNISRNDFTEVVPKMAIAFKKYAKDGILGEPLYFEQLADLQSTQSYQLMVEYTEKFIGKDVKNAWLKKDYKKVVKLYEMYEEFLTNDQKTKLEYAREQIKKKS